MKQFKLLLLMVFLLGVKTLDAAETEPNDTKAAANTLTLNGSNTGAINIPGDEDWWSVTTNADGKLDVTITVSNGLTLRCYIYDNDGTALLSSGYSSTTTTVSKDGVAAGTYYIRLIAFNAGQLPAYTISNILTVPAQANDTEPNGSRAQALNLSQNGSAAGHVGYYYNLQRDTADWYKVTTNADGLLRVSLIPANNKTVRVYLYDNNGTTLLNSDYSSTNVSVSEDGLAPGTYYVRVVCFNNSDFAPYSIFDSLFVPAQADDTEPNNAKLQASVLPLNDGITGHVGYYYNLQRDTADWYKVTTNADGLLRVSLIPANNKTVRVYLYDNNGTTLLNSDYSSTNVSVSEDGLAPGTYYVRVVCFNNSDFAPYTISDSLFTYTYTNDQEPDGKPFQAKTIPANGTTAGHAGFYYNNSRDTVDWWKINYTGSGNLDFTINLEPLKFDGGYNTLRFFVYKDTAATAIHSSYSSAATRNVHLTALTQGYYWIKIYPFNSSDFASYSFTNTFTQVDIASIKATAYDTLSSCASTNSITFSAKNSSAPYTVQLYRFGTAYRSAVVTSKKVVFKNLPTGSYYATAYGDGATGTAFGKSRNISVEPVPGGLSTTNVTNEKAKLNWTSVTCAAYYTVQYKIHGTAEWTTKKTNGNINNYTLKNLVADTTYDWRVASSDSANGITATGIYADSISFITAAALMAESDNSEDNLRLNDNSKNQAGSIMVSPNPATSYFVIHYNSITQQKVNAQLFDLNGRAVWSSGFVNTESMNGKRVNVSQFAKGVFYLKIMNESGVLTGSIKVIILQ